MRKLDNVMLVTIDALQSCRPKKDEWTSFGELYGKWAANAKTDRYSVFGMLIEERDAKNAVLLAAILHVNETHGSAATEWLMALFGGRGKSLEELTKICASCPDKSLLPLTPPEPVEDLLGIEELKGTFF